MNLIFFTLWVSLFDSLSTTIQIILFVLLLTTENPIRNALAYLAGLSGAYFACGIIGYLALDELRGILAQFIHLKTIPDAAYYQSEFLTGLLMVAFGFWYFFKKKKATKNRLIQLVLHKLKAMNSLFAFCVGAFISVTSFPLSIPYFIALGKYSAMGLGAPAAAGFILLYNFGYALPMALILFLYLFFRRNTEEYHQSLREKADKLNLHLVAWTLVGFGIFSMVDAGLFFTLGRALIQERFF